MGFLMGLWLATAPRAEAEDSSLKIQLERPLPPCRSKLDLMCGDPVAKGNWISFKPARERYQGKALTVRFGAPAPGRMERVEVQYGPWVQKALFIAALLATFVL